MKTLIESILKSTDSGAIKNLSNIEKIVKRFTNNGRWSQKNEFIWLIYIRPSSLDYNQYLQKLREHNYDIDEDGNEPDLEKFYYFMKDNLENQKIEWGGYKGEIVYLKIKFASVKNEFQNMFDEYLDNIFIV